MLTIISRNSVFAGYQYTLLAGELSVKTYDMTADADGALRNLTGRTCWRQRPPSPPSTIGTQPKSVPLSVAIGVVPLTGTKSDAHMRDDLTIFGFELTNDEINAIDALY